MIAKLVLVTSQPSLLVPKNIQQNGTTGMLVSPQIATVSSSARPLTQSCATRSSHSALVDAPTLVQIADLITGFDTSLFVDSALLTLLLTKLVFTISLAGFSTRTYRWGTVHTSWPTAHTRLQRRWNAFKRQCQDSCDSEARSVVTINEVEDGRRALYHLHDAAASSKAQLTMLKRMVMLAFGGCW